MRVKPLDDCVPNEPESLDDILRHHLPSILGRVRQAVSQAADAEDAVQDAVVWLLEKNGSDKNSLANLCTQAVQKAETTSRKEQRRVALLYVHVRPKTVCDPVDQYDFQEEENALFEAILDALDALDDDLRDVLIYRFLEWDHTLDQTAEKFGLTLAKVRSRIDRALNSIRETLGIEEK